MAVLPLCVTVWELCRAGGSPCFAPGRPRGRRLVYRKPYSGTDTGRKGVRVNTCKREYIAFVQLEALSKVSSRVEFKMTLVYSSWGFSLLQHGSNPSKNNWRCLICCAAYLHTVLRRLLPWFEGLWTRGLSSTRTPSTMEDSPNRRRS